MLRSVFSLVDTVVIYSVLITSIRSVVPRLQLGYWFILHDGELLLLTFLAVHKKKRGGPKKSEKRVKRTAHGS